MKHESYNVFPGRQHYVVMIPEKYPHLFLEGVQSIDSNPNTEDQEFGQYGFMDPVITEKRFMNETGTIAMNHYGYSQRVLRAAAGQNPEATFLYDKSYNGKVDFWENVYNRTRDKVMHSRYWFDAAISTSHSSTLEGVETYSLDFTAARCLEFEGKQIATETFTQTVAGQRQFTLMAAAIIDPAMNDVRPYPAGITLLSLRHELCPIQYALRVWVDGVILNDPDAAMISTQEIIVDGSPHLISTLFLKEPLQSEGQIVKVAWLADGDRYVAQSGVTQAPIMVGAEVSTTLSGGTLVFGNIITVHLSRSLSEASLTALSGSDFRLYFEDPYPGTVYVWTPAPGGISITPSVSGNVLEINFAIADGGVITEAGSGAPAPATWGPGVPARLVYDGVSMVGATDGLVSPTHSLPREEPGRPGYVPLVF